ncbi:MAG: hypothetical protein AAF974_05105 [Cyanobacteria bacterium P01_E01_bin.34]
MVSVLKGDRFSRSTAACLTLFVHTARPPTELEPDSPYSQPFFLPWVKGVSLSALILSLYYQVKIPHKSPLELTVHRLTDGLAALASDKLQGGLKRRQKQ